jgi:hypothetical protein
MKGAQGATGTQGAPGAPGAQGPAGTLNGYVHYRFSTAFLPTSGQTVVATLTPGSAGDYEVNGTADLGLNSDEWGFCHLDVQSINGSAFSATPSAINRSHLSPTTPLTETGQVLTLAGSVIREVCSTQPVGTHTGAAIYGAGLTASRLTGFAGGAPVTRNHRRPAQRFTVPAHVKADGAAAGTAHPHRRAKPHESEARVERPAPRPAARVSTAAGRPGAGRP